MTKWTTFFMIRIEFLGFRYHGWQKQEGFRSIQGMVDKTMLFILGHDNFKTLGCGRTDAKVSANDFAFELFLQEKVDLENLLEQLNQNLPSDIRAKKVEAVDADFNIIQNAKEKEYHYFFSFGEKSHPFNAPFIRDFGEHLDLVAMKEAAKEFEGIHNFKRYASKPSSNAIFEREISFSTIEPNTQLKGNFVPENSYVFKVRAKGFLRYQVRLMMGALVDVGRGDWSLEDLRQSLIDYDGIQIKHIAPSSALVLHKVDFYDASPVKHRHFIIHKPLGFVSQFVYTHKRKKRLLGELHDFPEKTMSIGRLDVNSEGLLFLTTDGKVSQQIRSKKVEKEYYVQVDGIIDEAAIEKLKIGVEIGIRSEKYMTLPCEASRLLETPTFPDRTVKIRDERHGPTSWASITIIEGKFRQVRKMTAAVGFPTLRLIRVRIGDIKLNDLMAGEVIEVDNF